MCVRLFVLYYNMQYATNNAIELLAYKQLHILYVYLPIMQHLYLVYYL